MKGHHLVKRMYKDCLPLQTLAGIKPDTLLLRQPKKLTYSLIRQNRTDSSAWLSNICIQET